ncbi:MAG: GNAT family N-acetyltransferase [Actinomycetia bacterium]|nr:GNAT family N-acetyltransferase [Actinomycetes bacterium]
MTSPQDVVPAKEPSVEPVLWFAGRPAPELSRFFYEVVGGPWHWVDRLDWSDGQWLDWVDRPEHRLASCWVDGAPAGYFELEQQGRSVEIAYFGLLSSFVGWGLGGWLLTEALRSAWAFEGTERVWVHTCSLDGPAALTNYRRRGLRRYEESIEWRRFAD